jgi:uroporphyrinogen III methyltransferase/synthase
VSDAQPETTPVLHAAVYFVGAGPGDAGLLTIRGRDCIRAADVIVHDPQIATAILRHAREDAEIIDVGHTFAGATAHDAVSYLMADKVREDKRVVRLKWGDPFVFDRGADEALRLFELGVPFEVIPGVPAGIAVPTYAGVPVAGPGVSTVTLVRGTEDDNRALAAVDWDALTRLDGTVVCYAGAQQLPQLLDAMLAHGWPSDGAATIVYKGTLTAQESVSGTVSELRETLRQSSRRGAGVLIAGRVVGFREHLRWFDTRPLFGRKVLVTRPREQAGELVDLLIAAGAEPIEVPMIRIIAPEDPRPLLEAAAAPAAFDTIVFASANAVDAFMSAFVRQHHDVRSLKGPLLCAAGTGTARRLAEHGVTADLVPDEFTAEGIVAALRARARIAGSRVLLPRADIGREVIAHALRADGADVTEVIAYRTLLETERREDGPDVYKMLLDGRIDVVTFTSASAVRNFSRVYGTDQTVDLLNRVQVATIGPVTAEAATQLGITVTIQPATYTMGALVDAIAAHFAASRV